VRIEHGCRRAYKSYCSRNQSWIKQFWALSGFGRSLYVVTTSALHMCVLLDDGQGHLDECAEDNVESPESEGSGDGTLSRFVSRTRAAKENLDELDNADLDPRYVRT
jgi:hypothetical protein